MWIEGDLTPRIRDFSLDIKDQVTGFTVLGKVFYGLIDELITCLMICHRNDRPGRRRYN